MLFKLNLGHSFADDCFLGCIASSNTLKYNQESVFKSYPICDPLSLKLLSFAKPLILSER